MLTSFKSQIGHTLGASGLSSLIRGVCAMQAGICPPTLNYRTPDPEIGLEATGFHVPRQPVDWPQPTGRPRRLQVNAFGFGGANYVVQLEENREDFGRVLTAGAAATVEADGFPVLRRHAATIEGVSFFKARIGNRPCRLAVVASDETESRAKATALLQADPEGLFSEKFQRGLARQGVFSTPVDQTIEPLAYIFAGQGSQYLGMGKDLYEAFPNIREWMDRFAAIADFDLLDLLFHSTEEDLQKTRWQQPALYTLEFAMAQQLMALGARPKALAGHSLGELVALAVSGVFSWQDGFGIVNKRAQCMDKASEMRGDPGTMVAVDAPMEYLEQKLTGLENVYFTNFNSPHQVVLGGDTVPVLTLMEEIKQEGFRATQLKVSMAFHSPIMRVIHEEMAEFVSGIAFHLPKIPVVSNTTMKPYPDDPDRIRRILMSHLESPVHWMQNVTTLWEDFGIRLFVEIGPRDTLCSLLGETPIEALCVPTCMPESEAHAYRTGVARLYALGQLTQEGIALSTESSRPAPTEPAQVIPQGPPAGDRIGAIVQRQINAFVMESFGKIIKPQIIEAVRRELDPGFTENQLDHLLKGRAAAPSLAEPQQVARPEPAAPASHSEPAKQDAPGSPGPAVTAAMQTGGGEIDFVEQTIAIIMNATGYDRDEIEPDMDLRQDLAIRSSRLPVIIDDIERQFDISVNIEDFIETRTVREIAGCIARLAGSRDTGTSPMQVTAAETLIPDAARIDPDASGRSIPEDESIKRLVLKESAIKPTAPVPLELARGAEVALFRSNPRSELAAELSRLLESKFGARVLLLDCLNSESGRRFDLRTAAGAQHLVQRLEEASSLAGIVWLLDGEAESALSGPEEASSFLSGIFSCFKMFLKSKGKAFCLSVTRDISSCSPTAWAGEGLLGMFLAATHEYPSLLFRSLATDRETTAETILELALDTANPTIQLTCHGPEAFTVEAAGAPLPMKAQPALELKAGDMVVISGGAKGVTHHIARALAPFRVRVVLLGRTELDTAGAYRALGTLDAPAESIARRLFNRKKKNYSGAVADGEAPKNLAGLDIARKVSRLSTLGLQAGYRTCDVADPRQVGNTLEEIARRYGRIDGIIHGAGLIRDNFMEYMTAEDFQRVTDVKFLGAWNLYRAAKDHGLRFFVGLSSIVAIQGNVGQINYCAANRSMAALIRSLPASHEGLVSKALMLPPIEGAGMADDPEVRMLMERRGLGSAFVHADELAQMFCRELILGPPHDAWVLLSRRFPSVKGTRVDSTAPPPKGLGRLAGGVGLLPGELPMIGEVEELDLKECRLTTKRTYSRDVDLWIDDHRPFKFLKHPLVSGIMAVEAFLEAAQLLYPYLTVRGVRKLTFEDVLECRPEVARETRTTCRSEEWAGQEVRCNVQMASADVSPSGRPLERWSTNYQGQVILGPGGGALPSLPDFEIHTEEMDTRPMGPEEVQASYAARTGLTGRYRVLELLHGTGPGTIKGEMVYREGQDMAVAARVAYLYSPYLLEALMHLFAFHAALRQEETTASLVPAAIGEMRYARLARNGERFILEARLRSRNDQGVIWDARALDETGAIVMKVDSVRMNHFGS